MFVCCKLLNNKSLFQKIYFINVYNSSINFHFFLLNFFIYMQTSRVSISNNTKNISVHFTHLLTRASLLLSLLLLSFLLLFSLFFFSWKFFFFDLIGIMNNWCMYFFLFFIFIISRIMHKFIVHYFIFFCINLMLYLIIHSFNQFLIFIND